jgi:methylase of polypeptide subunit release factors
VGDDEVEKLLRRGGEWLAAHPEREVIAERYLKHQRRLSDEALSRLLEKETEEVEGMQREEEAREETVTLGEQRLGAVVAALKDSGARSVLDLGCGEGKLLGALLQERRFEEIVGVDVSVRSLGRARRRLRLDRLPQMQRSRLGLLQGSLIYRDGEGSQDTTQRPWSR